MKKTILQVVLAGIIAFVGAGNNILPPKMEITAVETAVMIGIDKASANNVTVSLLLDGEEGGSVETETAAGIPSAIANIQKRSAKEIPSSNIACFVIGEEAVKEDIYRYIDFLSKDNEMRLNSQIYFARGASAGEVVKLAGEDDGVDVLRFMGENSGVTAITYNMEFIDFLRELCREPSAFAVPVINIMPGKDMQKLELGGYAIMTEGHFAGYIDPTEARGYNLIMNKPAHSIIRFDTQEGESASMLIETAEASTDFYFIGDELTGISINVTVDTNAADSGILYDITRKETIDYINNRQDEILRAEMTEVVRLSRDVNGDFLNLLSALKFQHPIRWVKIKENYADILSRIPIEINVTSRMQRTFDMVQLERRS